MLRFFTPFQNYQTAEFLVFKDPINRRLFGHIPSYRKQRNF